MSYPRKRYGGMQFTIVKNTVIKKNWKSEHTIPLTINARITK